MDLSQYRESISEQNRTDNILELLRLIPKKGENALEIGARDGHFSKLMTKFYRSVTALDLEKPDISDENIICVKGDAKNLEFRDNSFDLVLCAEVLEHIPSPALEKACSELSRVARKFLLIGVPYKQDIRVARTTCYSCGEKNPPWGHVNTFNKSRLIKLFPFFRVKEVSFVGENGDRTNFVSTFLMDLAGNPYGTYTQEEVCIHCGNKLKTPPERNLFQKVSTKAAHITKQIQKPLTKPHPNWIHILFEKSIH